MYGCSEGVVITALHISGVKEPLGYELPVCVLSPIGREAKDCRVLPTTYHSNTFGDSTIPRSLGGFRAIEAAFFLSIHKPRKAWAHGNYSKG